MLSAFAHTEDEPLFSDSVSPEIPWVWDPTLIFFLVLAWLYVRGLKKFKKKPVAPWQKVSFATGIFIQLLALNPWSDQLASELFFVHMIQHLMIILLAVPMILAGAPFFVIIRFLPLFVKRYLYWPLLKSSLIQLVHKTLSTPLISLVIFNLNFWFWHQPRWYNLALYHDFYHLLEHSMMAITSLYLWRHIIDPHPMRSTLSMGMRLLFLASFMALNIILAALLTYAPDPWYAYENIALPSWWAQNWTRLDDQKLGGLIMWVPGGIITFLYMTLCFFVWVKREQLTTPSYPAD